MAVEKVLSHCVSRYAPFAGSRDRSVRGSVSRDALTSAAAASAAAAAAAVVAAPPATWQRLNLGRCPPHVPSWGNLAGATSPAMLRAAAGADGPSPHGAWGEGWAPLSLGGAPPPSDAAAAAASGTASAASDAAAGGHGALAGAKGAPPPSREAHTPSSLPSRGATDAGSEGSAQARALGRSPSQGPSGSMQARAPRRSPSQGPSGSMQALAGARPGRSSEAPHAAETAAATVTQPPAALHPAAGATPST